MSKVVIIGGHGKIALDLARLLAQNAFTVTSVIRDPAQAVDITALSATPHLLSLEDAPVAALTALFSETRAQLVYFAAGAGGKGGPERVRTVDYEGAVKVFDAVEAVQGEKPRVILVSSMDTRNPDTALEKFPAQYDDEDKAKSRRTRVVLETYLRWKYEADKNLVARTAFPWTIIRPGGLIDEPGTGRVEIGRTHLRSISRNDVATTLFHLASRPDAHGLLLDVVGGETPVADALDLAIKKRETEILD